MKHVCVWQLQMRFLPKSKSHEVEGSVSSDTCGSASGSSTGTARARIARHGPRHGHSQSSPTHRDHAPEPSTHEWIGFSDEEDDDDDDDGDDVCEVGQQTRLLVSFDDDHLRDTRV